MRRPPYCLYGLTLPLLVVFYGLYYSPLKPISRHPDQTKEKEKVYHKPDLVKFSLIGYQKKGVFKGCRDPHQEFPLNICKHNKLLAGS